MGVFSFENAGVASAVDGLVHFKASEQEFGDDRMKCTKPFVLAGFAYVGMVEMNFHKFFFNERNGGACVLVLIGMWIGVHFIDGQLQFGFDFDW